MKKYLLGTAMAFVAVIYIWVVVLGNDPLQPSIASKILRFHVLANSNNEADQAVKEQVRDAVGTYLRPFLEEAGNIEETRRIVSGHLEKIVELSCITLRENGYDYEVEAKLTDTYFPEKTYGSYTFPKGTYEALEIIIGAGKGDNWWCVLYPNMCFKGTVYEVVNSAAGEELREVLSPWEYADVFDSGSIEIRSRVLEYFSK